jgi:YVTN family beta-propeller protein
LTNRIYLATEGGLAVAVLSGLTNRILAMVRVPGPNVFDLSINRKTNRIYALNTDFNGARGSVSIIDGQTNKVIQTIKVGRLPSDVCINAKTGLAYVSNNESNTVTVIG